MSRARVSSSAGWWPRWEGTLALHDLRCTVCGYIHEDVDIPVAVGARFYCQVHRCAQVITTYSDDGAWPVCRGPLEPVPAAHFSGFNDSGAGSFAKFTTQVEDPRSPSGWREITVGSLADIRREERESEQRARNGEGQQLIWRDYSQSASNRDKHTMMDDPSMKAPKFYSNGTPVRVRRGAPVIAEHGTVEQAEAGPLSQRAGA